MDPLVTFLRNSPQVTQLQLVSGSPTQIEAHRPMRMAVSSVGVLRRSAGAQRNIGSILSLENLESASL
jgi:hypothetical protein